jgi:hypothetical protein
VGLIIFVFDFFTLDLVWFKPFLTGFGDFERPQLTYADSSYPKPYVTLLDRNDVILRSLNANRFELTNEYNHIWIRLCRPCNRGMHGGNGQPRSLR